MPRVLDVVRIQLVHWPALLGYPLLALAAIPLLGWGIDVSNGETVLGAHEIYLLPAMWGAIAPAHLQTMTQVFPFTLGFGVTRRAFAAATALVVLGQALLLGLALVAFDVAERLTGGWGREARIFGLDMLGHGGPLTLWLVYSGPLVAVSAIGVLAGVVFQRWRHTGIYLAIFGSVALLAAVGVLGKARNWWPSIGRFLGGQSSFTLFTAYPLVFALALGSAAWLVLRRASA
jgi:uncharacterized membrane protein (UPF0136 family)